MNSHDFQGKNVLITGATGGLGSVVTNYYIEAGATVYAFYRSKEKFDKLAEQAPSKGSLHGFKGDVTDSGDCSHFVNKALEDLGHVDVLCNIAGGYRGGVTVAETGDELLDWNIRLNLYSVFYCSKAVLPHMMERGYGKILNISARQASQEGSKAKSGVYAASKAAVSTLTMAMAEEAAKYSVNVNCVLPGTIATATNIASYPKADHSKWVNPERIAELILYLTSDAASDTTGATVPIYGYTRR